jgi:glutathione S-transferase
MLELYQTEWCPSSRRVRERLTELGLDYVIRQVPVDRERRSELRELTGADTIPTLVPEGGGPVVGAGAIEAFLAEHYAAPPEAAQHRRKAERLRARYLEDECRC